MTGLVTNNNKQHVKCHTNVDHKHDHTVNQTLKPTIDNMAKMHNNEAHPTDIKFTESASIVLICSDKTQTQITIIITKALSLLRRYAVSTGKYLPTLLKHLIVFFFRDKHFTPLALFHLPVDTAVSSQNTLIASDVIISTSNIAATVKLTQRTQQTSGAVLGSSCAFNCAQYAEGSSPPCHHT